MGTRRDDTNSGSSVGFALGNQSIPPTWESATLSIVSQPVSSTLVVTPRANIAHNRFMGHPPTLPTIQFVEDITTFKDCAE